MEPYEMGYRLLSYIGMPELNSEEKEIFKGQWAPTYSEERSIVDTTYQLFAETLPLALSKGIEGVMTAYTRLENIGQKLKEAGLRTLDDRELEAVLDAS